jgi:chanoclavine-I dehydrogenase
VNAFQKVIDFTMASVFSKIFAITGGASGIGAATCRLLAERGAATLCVGDISSDKFDQLKSDIAAINPSTTVKFTKLNVTSPDEVERWIEDIVAEFGDFHGAANVAGIAQAEGIRKSPAILEENDEEWRRIFNVNVDGVFFCTRAQVRAMHRLPTSNRSIVNVTSIASMAHTPDVYAYGASKGCAAYFTTCVAPDAFPWGIRVNSVSPGRHINTFE